MSMDQQLVDNDKKFSYKEQNPEYPGEALEQALVQGPLDSRRCTDVLCCLLFAIYWVGLIVVAVFAFQQGQPHLLAAPFDSTGYQCGYSPGYENFPYALFNQFNSSQFCCVDFCPKINNFSTSNCRYDNQSIACPLFGLYNTSRLIDICYPTNSSEFTQAINLSMGEFEQGMSDIRLTWPIELAVLFIALIISVFFMYLIKWCGACLIWTLIFLFFALTACFGGLCYYMYENPQFADEVLHTQMVSNLQGLEWIAIGIWTFDGIILIIFIVCFKSIRVAIAVIKATATFTEEKVRTIIIPFVMFLVMAIFFILWALVSIYIFSSGKVTKCSGGSPYGCVSWNETIKSCLGYYIFALFWNCEFAIGMCQFVIASAASYWYFSHGNEKLKDESHICKSFWRGLFYHGGSIAFGALILLIVWVLQLFFELFHKCSKQKSMDGNSVEKTCDRCCVDCLRCGLACFERFMRFISKNAFIMMAIKGGTFCSSAHDAFYLIMRTKSAYALTQSAASLVTHFGKLLVTVICTICGYLMITNITYFSLNLFSPVGPTLVFFVVSFVVASLFMDVFGAGSDTILLCYALELDILKGAAKSCPVHLQGFFTKAV